MADSAAERSAGACAHDDTTVASGRDALQGTLTARQGALISQGHKSASAPCEVRAAYVRACRALGHRFRVEVCRRRSLVCTLLLELRLQLVQVSLMNFIVQLAHKVQRHYTPRESPSSFARTISV